MSLCRMGAAEASEAIAAGKVSSEELTRACLDQIEKLEPTIRAWTHLDPAHAVAQARAADAVRARGRAVGPLHGVPIGIKDIFDTSDFPSEYGTPIHAGRRPAYDAAAVARLRAAGAVILGKTVTTEMAYFSPGQTTNPHEPSHSPGGSSSGSAAAVAAFMVPAALGSQTNGSTIRPASYCGVYGFKPSHGLISRSRMLQQSRALDHVGVFARSIADLALVGEALVGHDEGDPDTAPRAALRLPQIAAQAPPMTPRLAFVRGAPWADAAEDTRAGFAELVDHLGERVVDETLPGPFDQAIAFLTAIHEADLARALRREYARGRDQLSPRLREAIERGRTVSAVAYNDAVTAAAAMTAQLATLFHDYDAIITPATAGEAPHGLASTGSPAFCSAWTLCGVPALSLPLLRGASGLPVGVQLVGAKGDDARLLRTAQWLVKMCET